MAEHIDLLHEIYRKLMQALRPEDIFGLPPQGIDARAHFDDRHRALARSIHPDLYRDHDELRGLAQDAAARLEALHREATARRDPNRDLGHAASATILQASQNRYILEEAFARGDFATLYHGRLEGSQGPAGRVVLKIADDPGDNDLLLQESKVARRLQEHPSRQSPYLPVLLDTLRTQDNRLANVLRFCDGVDLYEVQEKYPQGVPPQHLIWIFRRCLSALGYAHSQGILHGNLEPGHVLVRAQDHAIFLIDWTCAIVEPARTGQGFRFHNATYSPPEVAARKPPLPSSDLYSLGKTMLFLAGADMSTLECPDTYDPRLARFLRFFVKESPLQRAQDAWELFQQLGALRKEIFGQHRFQTFVL